MARLTVQLCSCTLQGGIDPTGSSGFADYSPLHTDVSVAVPAMAIIFPKVAAYIEWAGMEVNVPKSPKTAIDMQTGQQVPTDSITVPSPCMVSPSRSFHPINLTSTSDCESRRYGANSPLNGDFSAEKEHVCRDMRQRLAALDELDGRVLSRKEKELVIKTAACMVICNSAGFVDWNNTELECISKMRS